LQKSERICKKNKKLAANVCFYVGVVPVPVPKFAINEIHRIKYV
jgi:hypothetical protein